MKTLLFTFLAIIIAISLSAQDYVSVQSGDWNVGTTWNTGTIPSTNSNNVTISSGHTVTLGNVPNLVFFNYSGILIIEENAWLTYNSTLTDMLIAGGTVTVNGTLTVTQDNILFTNHSGTVTVNGELIELLATVTATQPIGGKGAIWAESYSGSANSIFGIPPANLTAGKWAAPSTFSNNLWFGAGGPDGPDPSLGAIAISYDLTTSSDETYSDPIILYVSQDNTFTIEDIYYAPSMEIRGEGEVVVASGGSIDLQ